MKRGSLPVVAVLALLVTSACSHATTTSKPSHQQPLPIVDTKATPSGWLPVDYGNAQISVPSTWALVHDGEAQCGSSPGVIILGAGEWCPPSMNAPSSPSTSIVTLKTVTRSQRFTEPPVLVTNGIPVYAPGVAPVYLVPALDVEISFSGPQEPQVLKTLTYSPRAVVLAPGRTMTVLTSWRWVSFSGVKFAVPGGWSVRRTTYAPPCSSGIVLPMAGVTLASQPPLSISCPPPQADLRPVPQVAGVEVDGFSSMPEPHPACVGPRTINGLSVCIEAGPTYQVLIDHVASPNLTVQIGLAGDGLTARTILYSLRPG